MNATKKDYKINFVKLNLPSRVKLTTTVKDLEDTLTQLDSSNIYNLEVTGASTTEHLAAINAYACVSKFSFTEEASNVDIAEIADDLKEAGDTSVSDIIMVALDDVELNEEELARAKSILAEVL